MAFERIYRAFAVPSDIAVPAPEPPPSIDDLMADAALEWLYVARAADVTLSGDSAQYVADSSGNSRTLQRRSFGGFIYNEIADGLGELIGGTDNAMLSPVFHPWMHDGSGATIIGHVRIAVEAASFVVASMTNAGFTGMRIQRGATEGTLRVLVGAGDPTPIVDETFVALAPDAVFAYFPFAVTFDSDALKFYVGGALIGSVAPTGTPSASAGETLLISWKFGEVYSTAFKALAGYSRVLDASEIETIHTGLSAIFAT